MIFNDKVRDFSLTFQQYYDNNALENIHEIIDEDIYTIKFDPQKDLPKKQKFNL